MKGLRLSDETVLVEFGKDYAIFHDDGNGFWYWQFDGITAPEEYAAEAWNEFMFRNDTNGCSCGGFDTLDECKADFLFCE